MIQCPHDQEEKIEVDYLTSVERIEILETLKKEQKAIEADLTAKSMPDRIHLHHLDIPKKKEEWKKKVLSSSHCTVTNPILDGAYPTV